MRRVKDRAKIGFGLKNRLQHGKKETERALKNEYCLGWTGSDRARHWRKWVTRRSVRIPSDLRGLFCLDAPPVLLWLGRQAVPSCCYDLRHSGTTLAPIEVGGGTFVCCDTSQTKNPGQDTKERKRGGRGQREGEKDCTTFRRLGNVYMYSVDSVRNRLCRSNKMEVELSSKSLLDSACPEMVRRMEAISVVP